MSVETLTTHDSENLTTPSPQLVTLNLLFNYNNGNPTWEWSSSSLGWNSSTDTITINAATANFTIALDSSSTEDAALTGEIRWLRPTPVGHIKQPPAITHMSFNTTTEEITFTDNNPEGNKTWNFQVWVGYGGKGYLSTDPTIINADVGTPV